MTSSVKYALCRRPRLETDPSVPQNVQLATCVHDHNWGQQEISRRSTNAMCFSCCTQRSRRFSRCFSRMPCYEMHFLSAMSARHRGQLSKILAHFSQKPECSQGISCIVASKSTQIEHAFVAPAEKTTRVMNHFLWEFHENARISSREQLREESSSL